MEKIRDMTDFIKLQKNMLILFWNRDRDWEMICEDRSLVFDRNEAPGLRALRKLVAEEDLSQYDLFLDKITGCLDENAEKKQPVSQREHVAVRLLKSNTNTEYFMIDCRLEYDEADIVTKMLVLVSEMDAEEVYCMKLAEQTTLDNSSDVIDSYCRDIIRSHPECQYAVVQFDIAKFKIINEIYGEAVGDDILDYFIRTLKFICGHEQAYARLSADIFMIVTPYETVEDIYGLIRKIDETLLGYKELSYKLFYGVSFINDIRDGFRKYSDEAAIARQSVKGDALQHIGFFNDELRETIIARKFIEDNMERAIESRQFVMYLQPKYSISKGVMVGAEALVRWFHPEKGMILPSDFIPVMEENGFIIKLDYFMWEEACRLIRKWLDQGVTPLPISVNVSRRHLKTHDFIDVLNHLIRKYEIPKDYLEIEITETMEEEKMHYGINLLKDSGYKLLMDDFGSGYSSLNMLKDTKFDILKIDRRFLQDFSNSERGQRIVEHTIHMTQAIGLDIIAEGVETEEQALFLKTCGCDTAQCFYYARPMSEEDFNRAMLG